MALSAVKRRLTIVETEISGRNSTTTLDQKLALIEQLVLENISKEDRALLTFNPPVNGSAMMSSTKGEPEALNRRQEAWITAIASSRIRFTIEEIDSLFSLGRRISG